MFQSSGKNERYESWVKSYASDLYRFAYRLAGRQDTAEDLVQETFYHAWRSMNKLNDPNKARAWLHQILRYRYAHWVRDETRRPRLTGSIEAAEDRMDSSITNPLETLAEQDELAAALDSLDDRFKIPFLMVFLEGRTCKEVGEALELPLGTVLSRIHRARTRLKAALGGSETAMGSQPQDTGGDSGELRIGDSA